jgi:uncharacterized RDD family membrane protein YckC
MDAGRQEVSPYAPPRAEEAAPGFAPGPVETASRWRRLGGALVDGLAVVLAHWPANALANHWGVKVALGPLVLNLANTSPQGPVWTITVMAIWVGQSYFIATRGQTIGKMVVETRIVATDGAPASFVKAVLLRTWLFLLLAQLPVVGYGSIMGVLLIFGPSRRCIHDYVAGTRVVLAR